MIKPRYIEYSNKFSTNLSPRPQCQISYWAFLHFKIQTRNTFLPLPLQGRVGIPAVWATMEDAILSPKAHIAWLGGPKNKQEKNF